MYHPCFPRALGRSRHVWLIMYTIAFLFIFSRPFTPLSPKSVTI